MLKAQLIEIMNIPEKLIKLEAFCDNKDVVQAVHSSKQTQKGRIRVDIGNIKDMLEQNVVNSLTWIRTQLQYADCLTKSGASSQMLTETIKRGHFLQ